MTEQNEYLVTWQIDILAESKLEAAQHALEIMRDKNSIATFFEVAPHEDLKDKELIDLLNNLEGDD